MSETGSIRTTVNQSAASVFTVTHLESTSDHSASLCGRATVAVTKDVLESYTS